ncbi:MAG: hypothetical protein AMS21_12295 [Gemmatimonas sp. SG8_38_2]|nr:MAG: hypothetical protein AMS21_12295 [Gemmatimonas sp. SG8_38_2]
MSEVLIIVAVVAVIAIAAVLVLRGRRKAGPEEATDAAAVVPPAPAEPITAPRAEKPAVEVAVAAAQAEVVEQPSTASEKASVDEVEFAEAAVDAEPVEAAPSEEELAARVEAQLQESERMLGELRGVAGGDEGSAQQVLPGTVDIMQEGLQEVRGLVSKKDWSQAKDKGDALHAQLSLMVQSVRCGQAT